MSRWEFACAEYDAHNGSPLRCSIFQQPLQILRSLGSDGLPSLAGKIGDFWLVRFDAPMPAGMVCEAATGSSRSEPTLFYSDDAGRLMTEAMSRKKEPAWNWIIGGGLTAIFLGGVIVQVQFGGVQPEAGFSISSSYESVLSPLVTRDSGPGGQAEPAAEPADSPAFPLTIVPYTPSPELPEHLIAPCQPGRAQEIQAAWARHLNLPGEIRNRLGMTFRLIPPGIYDRGGNPSAMKALLESMPAEDEHWQACLASSTPVHRVVLTQPFYLATNETTQAQYQAIQGKNPSWFSESGAEPYYRDLVAGEDTRLHPVEGVTWLDAQTFAKNLSESDWGILELSAAEPAASPPLLNPVYRLPTDAEWEHACRGGTNSPFSFGDAEPHIIGWFGEPNRGRTWNVGQDAANSLGLRGVHSRVWEWVEDQWEVGQYAAYREWPVTDPKLVQSSALPRVVRGGMWPDRRSRSFDRYAYDADFQTFFVGFRLGFSVPMAAETSLTEPK